MDNWPFNTSFGSGMGFNFSTDIDGPIMRTLKAALESDAATSWGARVGRENKDGYLTTAFSVPGAEKENISVSQKARNITINAKAAVFNKKFEKEIVEYYGEIYDLTSVKVSISKGVLYITVKEHDTVDIKVD